MTFKAFLPEYRHIWNSKDLISWEFGRGNSPEVMFLLKIDHGYVSVTATFDTPVTKDFGSTDSRNSCTPSSVAIIT